MTDGTPIAESKFTLRAFWFIRGRNSIHSDVKMVPNLNVLRRLIQPYRRRKSIALYLERDEFETGAVWAHCTGNRAWLAHFDCPGGTDSYAHDPLVCAAKDDLIGFRLNNGQVDHIHRSWTVSRKQGFQALEHFLIYGNQDTNLHWISQPGDLEVSA